MQDSLRGRGQLKTQIPREGGGQTSGMSGEWDRGIFNFLHRGIDIFWNNPILEFSNDILFACLFSSLFPKRFQRLYLERGSTGLNFMPK